MRKIKHLTLALSLLLSAGIVFGQAEKSASKTIKTNSGINLKKAQKHDSMLPAFMDPNFIPQSNNQVISEKPNLNGTKSNTAYGWNAYGGTTAVGPCSIDLPAGTLTSIAASAAGFVAGADWANGVWYGVQYAASPALCPLVTVDPATGTLTNIGGGVADLTGLAFDVNTQIMYTMAFGGNLYTINLTTGATTLVGTSTAVSIISIACDNLGNLFAISLDDNLYSINKTTGASTLVGPLGVAINYAQDIAYDRDNEILYGTLYTTSGGLYTIDKVTGTATLIIDFVSEVTGFAIPYTPVASSAPGPVVNLTVTPDTGGALTYDITWDNPTLDFSGAALSDISSISFFVDNVLVTGLTYNLTVGGANSFTGLTVATAGYHIFKVVCTNSAGDGLPVSVTEWIGFIPPDNITFNTIEDISANVAWTQVGTPLSWDIEILTTGTPPTGTPSYNTAINPYGLTGLTATTTYDVYMRADYSGGNSLWVGPFSFTTLCSNVNTFPLVESFDGTTFAPMCWLNPSPSGWDRQTAGTNPTCTPHTGAAMARYYSYNFSSGTTGILVSPGIDLPSDLYEVRFWMYRDNGYATSADLVNVYYNTASNTTGATLLGTINRSNTLAPVEATANQWYEYIFSMPVGSTGNGRYVIFEAVSDYGNNIFIDDVAIEAIPTCTKPTALTATSITMTSAVLGWTNGGTETAWNIEYGPFGFTQGSGTVVPVTANPYTLSGLTAGTSYDFYIQADCGGSGTSLWAGPFTFNTLCDVVTTFPYTEGFETALMPPACWSSNDADGDTYNWEIRDGSSGWRIYAGAQVAVSASWVSGVGPLTPDNYLISPQFAINAANLECTFWVAAQDYDYAGEHYSVMISTTNTTPASFTEVFNETLSDTLYHKITVPLATYNGQSIYIAIRHWNVTDMFYMSLDEFAVDYTTGIKENVESTISVYPNPAFNTLYVSNTKNPIVTIYNNLGEVVLSTNKKAVDVSALSQGLYIVKVIDNNETYTKQINILK